MGGKGRQHSEDVRKGMAVEASDRELLLVRYLKESKHQGSSENQIVKFFEKENEYGMTMAQDTVKKYLKILVESRKWVSRAPPSKQGLAARYFVDEYNPVVTIPQQLSGFRTTYRILLQKSKEKAFSVFGPPANEYDTAKYLRFMIWPLTVYAALTRIHYLYVIIVLPSLIKDVQARKELNTIVMSLMLDIQSDISQIFGFFGEEDVVQQIKNMIVFERQPIFNDIISPALLFQYLLCFEQDGVDEYAKPVLNALWELSKETINITLPAWWHTRVEDDGASRKVDDWLSLVNMESDMQYQAHPQLNRSKYKAFARISSPPKSMVPTSDDKRIKKAMKEATTVVNPESITSNEAKRIFDEAQKTLAEAYAVEKVMIEYSKRLKALDPLNDKFPKAANAASANMYHALLKLGYSHAEAIDRVNEENQQAHDTILGHEGVSLTFRNEPNPFH